MTGVQVFLWSFQEISKYTLCVLYPLYISINIRIGFCLNKLVTSECRPGQFLPVDQAGTQPGTHICKYILASTIVITDIRIQIKNELASKIFVTSTAAL